jgi:hypothetical protein
MAERNHLGTNLLPSLTILEFQKTLASERSRALERAHKERLVEPMHGRNDPNL